MAMSVYLYINKYIYMEGEKERHVQIFCCRELRLPGYCSNNIHGIEGHKPGRFLPLVEVELHDLRFYDVYIYIYIRNKQFMLTVLGHIRTFPAPRGGRSEINIFTFRLISVCVYICMYVCMYISYVYIYIYIF